MQYTAFVSSLNPYAWVAPVAVMALMSIYWALNPKGDPPVSRARKVIGFLVLASIVAISGLAANGFL